MTVRKLEMKAKTTAIVFVLMVVVVMVIPSTVAGGAYASTAVPSNEDFTEEERESGFYDETGFVLDTDLRPAINPDLDPDEDCNLQYELKCIPGSQQSCFDELEGFNNGENNVCTPVDCQEGYHSVDDDETGLCYPNDEPCNASLVSYDYDSRFEYILAERPDGKGYNCYDPGSLCDENGDQPDHPKCDEYREWRDKYYPPS
jgi:hypothetical protein